MRLKTELLFCLLFCSQLLSAQNQDESLLPAELEAITAIPEQELDLSELGADARINLNTASSSELSTLHMLNLSAIASLLEHIRLYGPLQSVYELQTIEGYEADLIKRMLPYVNLNTPFRTQLKQASGQHQIMYRTAIRKEPSAAYIKPNAEAYMGSPLKWGLRYRANFAEALSFGLQLEKDAGESYQTLFTSAWLCIANYGRLKQVLLGNQQISFGQGLLIGSGLRTGKSAMVMQILKTRSGAKPYTSFNESGYVSGISTRMALSNQLELNLFGGTRCLDALIETDSNGRTYHSGVIGSGYYRTRTELARRHTLIQSLSGASLHYRKASFELGAGSVFSNTRIAAAQAKSIHTKAAETDGKAAIEWKWQLGNLLWFGETVFTVRQNPSFLSGFLIAAGKRSDISILARRYDSGFKSDLSNAFGESGKNEDEQGLFCGLQMQLPGKLHLNLYNDLSRFKQFRFRVNAASYVSEQFAELQYRDKRPLQIRLQYRQISRQFNQSGPFQIRPLQEHLKQTVRLQIEYKSGPFRLRNRFEQNFYRIQNTGLSTGMLMFQDIECKMSGRIRVNARLSVFDAENYLSRSFAFENDMPGTYSINAYNGKGLRYYLLMQIQMTKDLKIWFRFARSSYETDEAIVPYTKANFEQHQTDLSMQLLWKL